MYNFLIDHLSFLTNQPYRLEKLAWEKFWSTFKGERGTFFVLKRLKGYKGSWFQNLRSLHASIFCFSTPLKILSMSSYQIPAARVRQLSPYHFLFFCLFIYFSSFFFFFLTKYVVPASFAKSFHPKCRDSESFGLPLTKQYKGCDQNGQPPFVRIPKSSSSSLFHQPPRVYPALGID